MVGSRQTDAMVKQVSVQKRNSQKHEDKAGRAGHSKDKGSKFQICSIVGICTTQKCNNQTI